VGEILCGAECIDESGGDGTFRDQSTVHTLSKIPREISCRHRIEVAYLVVQSLDDNIQHCTLRRSHMIVSYAGTMQTFVTAIQRLCKVMRIR
jgi:hypothetical protein